MFPLLALNLLFSSKWCTQVLSAVEILWVSQKASLDCSGNINHFHLVLCPQHSRDTFCTHLADFQTVGIKTELMPMDRAICRIVRCRSSKNIWWMVSTCSSVVEIFGWTDLESSFVLSLFDLNSAAHFFTLAALSK